MTTDTKWRLVALASAVLPLASITLTDLPEAPRVVVLGLSLIAGTVAGYAAARHLGHRGALAAAVAAFAFLGLPWLIVALGKRGTDLVSSGRRATAPEWRPAVRPVSPPAIGRGRPAGPHCAVCGYSVPLEYAGAVFVGTGGLSKCSACGKIYCNQHAKRVDMGSLVLLNCPACEKGLDRL
jgi:hypothetical protein